MFSASKKKVGHHGKLNFILAWLYHKNGHSHSAIFSFILPTSRRTTTQIKCRMDSETKK
uniref:Uncharacterized protein n=1 Tax=Rhizophora mucronata TaxID=61149 RepID=A0A2P2NPQ1_RHIMU